MISKIAVKILKLIIPLQISKTSEEIITKTSGKNQVQTMIFISEMNSRQEIILCYLNKTKNTIK